MKRGDDKLPIILISHHRMGGMKTEWTWRRYAKHSVQYRWGRAVITHEAWEVHRFNVDLDAIKSRVTRAERMLTGL